MLNLFGGINASSQSCEAKYDAAGNWTEETTTDIASGLTLETKTVTSRDDRGRALAITYGDSTTETFTYSCCGLVAQTDRDGTETTFANDDLKRRTEATRAGVTTLTEYDADSNVLRTIRVGSDSSEILQEENTYDLAGRLTATKNALEEETTFAETYGSGEVTKTTTLTDGTTTIIEKSYPDGSPKSVSGTGAHPKKYEQGVETGLAYTKEIRVGASGAEMEWTKTFTDMAGRPVRTEHADGATSISVYNAKGQMIQSVDPDGVTMLRAYDGQGQPVTMAVDLDGNGQIDEGSTVRITKIARNVANAHGKVVAREETTVFTTNGSGATQVQSVVERSVDGLDTWMTSYGLTTHQQKTHTGAGDWTETQTAPDNSVVVSVHADGRLQSRTRKASAAGTQLARTDFTYDPHGRTEEEIDARNGTTAYAYDDLDRVMTVTQPSADGTVAAQETTYEYNALGQRIKTILPDASETESEYFPTGELKKTFGSQTYTQEYTYDPQGRMKTLTTTGQAGPAVTTWTYDGQRGWMAAKRYDDNMGPDYTYTAAGRLSTRTWERGVSTTYSFNAAGDMTGVNYSDSTPDVTYTYDRRGQRTQVQDGSGTRTVTYNSAGQPTAESYSAGLLNGLSVHRAYDSQLRYETLTVKSGTSTLNVQSFGYGNASRLASVGMGSEVAEYGYLTNSSLVGTVTFKHSGTTVMTTTKSYDFVNRLTSTMSVTGTTTVSSHAYDYSALNQRNRVDLADGGYWLYTYNSKGEVTNGTRYDSSNNPVTDQNFGYAFDGIGNRETTSIDGVTSGTYAANELNQYTSIVTTGTAAPTYDNDGNMTDNGTILAEYDGENRVKAVRRKSDSALIATYTYDDQSRRVRKTTTSIAPQGEQDRISLWDNWLNVAELDHDSGAFDALRFNAWGPDLSGSREGAGGVGGLVFEKDVSSNNAYMPSYDGNGNVVTLVKASDGSVAAEYTYDPLGNVIASSGAYADQNPWRYSTKFFDEETAWLYYGYRYYNPEIGRWASRDPLEEEGGLNLYGFLRNDLVNGIDPLGDKILSLSIEDSGTSEFESLNAAGLYWKYLLEPVYVPIGGDSGLGFRKGYGYEETALSYLGIGKGTKVSGALFKWEARADWCIPADKGLPKWQATVIYYDHYKINKTTHMVTQLNSGSSKSDGPTGQYSSIRNKNVGDVVGTLAWDAPRFYEPISNEKIYFRGIWKLDVSDSVNKWSVKFRLSFDVDAENPINGSGKIEILEAPHEVH